MDDELEIKNIEKYDELISYEKKSIIKNVISSSSIVLLSIVGGSVLKKHGFDICGIAIPLIGVSAGGINSIDLYDSISSLNNIKHEKEKILGSDCNEGRKIRD